MSRFSHDKASPSSQHTAGSNSHYLRGIFSCEAAHARKFSPKKFPLFQNTPSIPSRLRAFAGILLALALPASAMTVSIQGGFAGSPGITDHSGQALPSGQRVSIGAFADGFDPAQHAADLPSLLANWHELSAAPTQTIFGSPGAIWLEASDPDGESPGGFRFSGKKIHILLTLTAGPDSGSLPDGSNVLAYAVFTSTDPAWVFPPVGPEVTPPDDLADLYISQITHAYAGTADPATGTFALASYRSDPSNPSAPSAFEQWLAATFGAGSSVAPETPVGPHGVAALAVFALDAHPASAEPPYATITDPATGRIGIEFTRKKPSASGFDTHAQACTDLSSWTLPVSEEIIAETETTETVQAFPAFPEGADPSKAFFRIRVEPSRD